MFQRIRKLTLAQVAATLAASVLALGAAGLMAPSASAATAAGSQPMDGPLGNNGCHIDQMDGGIVCTVFDIARDVKPVLDLPFKILN